MPPKKGKEKKQEEETALAVQKENVSLDIPMEQRLTKEQKDLIKRCFAKNATDDELKIYFNFCDKAGVDPLRGQSHFIKYNANDKPIMMIGIDGFQARATSDPRYNGMVASSVYENDNFEMNPVEGTISHSFSATKRGSIIGAYAILKRKDMVNAVQWVDFKEYYKDQTNWKKMPDIMITKVARATLLRREYPDNFSGIYVPEEFNAEITEKGDFIDHAAKPTPPPFPDGVPVKQDVQDAEFKEEKPYLEPHHDHDDKEDAEPEPEESETLIPEDLVDDKMTPRAALTAIMDYAWKNQIGDKIRPIICKHYEPWTTGTPETYNIPETNVIAIVQEIAGKKLKKAEKAKKCKGCDMKITEPEAEEQEGLCLPCFQKKQESEE